MHFLPSKGAVWKAIVDHKLMRAANEHFGSDYYQKLLSNCSVTKNLSSAAKQGSSLNNFQIVKNKVRGWYMVYVM